ncbi:hypothetical protein [Candidatus Nucleicultrix amoebiphila]|jgi:hypothetical protein|uniref:Uncharacterized protein n=1 Tax=Candidatus Nucleicultrix amoebiphila FS5 TaxID=1414854 RepID=A0A1W6N4V7_9PROT|nr:hypothetical protein [Candidatus Nucleicultrix amoebiphila]ARN84798.1 hypothetical protein GQ61_05290 [Candidatus Nucleicultrix amoebiphila FS5]
MKVFTISALFFITTTAHASSLPDQFREDKPFRPISMKTGSVLGGSAMRDLERKTQGTQLRNMMKLSATPEFEELRAQATANFNTAFTTRVNPKVIELLPIEIIFLVPPALINKANFLNEFTPSEDDGIVGSIVPSAKNVDALEISKAFVRLALLIKDESAFGMFKDELMKVCFLKASEHQRTLESMIPLGNKADYYTSLGQVIRWAAFRARSVDEQKSLLKESLSNFEHAQETLTYFLTDYNTPWITRESFAGKIMTEIDLAQNRLRTIS